MLIFDRFYKKLPLLSCRLPNRPLGSIRGKLPLTFIYTVQNRKVAMFFQTYLNILLFIIKITFISTNKLFVDLVVHFFILVSIRDVEEIVLDGQEHYSEIEVEELICGLTNAQIAKVHHVYRNKGCNRRAGITEFDVFQNAVMQALSGTRAWKKGLSAEAYLIESGRSFISNESEKYARNVYESQFDNMQIDAFTPEADDGFDYTDESLIQEWIEKIIALFPDDKDALCFLEKKLAQIKKARTLLLCEFTDQVYRNVEKRIKDKARKRFPSGVSFNEVAS